MAKNPTVQAVDYSSLLTVLNTANVQKDNPGLYQFLSELLKKDIELRNAIIYQIINAFAGNLISYPWNCGNFVPPVDSQFVWINQGAATISQLENKALYLLGPATTGPNFRIRKQTAPSTPYTVTIAFFPFLLGLNFQNVGLVFRESSTGRLHSCQYSMNTTQLAPHLGSIKWTSPTAFSADYVTSRGIALNGIAWLRIADNGTNRICSYSSDGHNWITFHTVGRTDFLTANEIGFFVNTETTTFDVAMTLLSWELG